MAISRVTNFTIFNSTLGDVTDVQRQLATIQEQISSGLKAQTFEDMNGQVEQFTQLDARIRSAKNYIDTNENNIARMKTADQAMAQMTDIADQMENLIVLGSSSTVQGSLNFEQQMRANLEALANQLNVDYAGRFIFGGTNTSTAPVPDPGIVTNSIGTPDDSYYAGSQASVTYSMDERTTYEFPMRADDPSIQKIFAAAWQAIQGFNNKDFTALGQALDLMQEGQTELSGARSRVNSTIINATDTNDRLKSLQLYWQGVTESIGKTDMVAASTAVANYEAVLQATFSAYARLSQLKLSDYL